VVRSGASPATSAPTTVEAATSSIKVLDCTGIPPAAHPCAAIDRAPDTDPADAPRNRATAARRARVDTWARADARPDGGNTS
jgi:hypothetical protein